MKTEAMNELQILEETRLKRDKKTRISKEARERSEAIELRAFLFDYHFPKSQPVVTKTLPGKQLEKELDWSQKKVSDTLKRVFKQRLAATFYRSIFATHAPDKGCKVKFEDATQHLEAIWLDKNLYED